MQGLPGGGREIPVGGGEDVPHLDVADAEARHDPLGVGGSPARPATVHSGRAAIRRPTTPTASGRSPHSSASAPAASSSADPLDPGEPTEQGEGLGPGERAQVDAVHAVQPEQAGPAGHHDQAGRGPAEQRPDLPLVADVLQQDEQPPLSQQRPEQADPLRRVVRDVRGRRMPNACRNPCTTVVAEVVPAAVLPRSA